jgi:hypothetical protein
MRTVLKNQLMMKEGECVMIIRLYTYSWLMDLIQ